METWLERLKEFKNNRGLTIKDIAKLSFVPEPTLEKLFAGQTKDPKLSTIYAVVHSLGHSLDDLDAPKKQKNISVLSADEQRHFNQYRVLDAHGKDMVDTVLQKEYDRVMSPAIEEVSGNQAKTSLLFFEFPASAGTGENLPEEEKRYIMMPKRLVPSYADCCIRISGDSMEPDYCDGDIVFVQLIESVPVGSVGIFTLNGAGYIKKLGRNQLLSLNPNYAPIPFGDGDSIRCVGRVLGIADKNAWK